MKKTIRIATRKSPLALWQAQYVKSLLLRIDPDLNITFVGLTTEGDKEQTRALKKEISPACTLWGTGRAGETVSVIGGKLLFVKELQNALLHHSADIAAHSIKDLSVQDVPGLTLAAICEREDPRDAFISKHYASINDLPEGAIIGTASPRRTALLKSQRPDVQTKVIRGNVGTRLDKCKQGEYDAIILAVAGLKRLNLDDHISEYLDPKLFIPAIGQGAIGVECRQDDRELCRLLNSIHHSETTACVRAERAVNRILGGGCRTPIAAYATIKNQQLHLRSMVGSLDGKTMIHSELAGPADNAVKLGETVGQQLLEKGAVKLL